MRVCLSPSANNSLKPIEIPVNKNVRRARLVAAPIFHQKQLVETHAVNRLHMHQAFGLLNREVRSVAGHIRDDAARHHKRNLALAMHFVSRVNRPEPAFPWRARISVGAVVRQHQLKFPKFLQRQPQSA